MFETSLAQTREIFNSQELAHRKIFLRISLHRGIDLKGTGVTRSARHLRDIIAWKFNEGFDKTMIQDCPGCINKSWYRAISTAKSFWFPLYGCLQCLTRVCFVSIGRHLPLLHGRILLQALQSAQRHLADPGEGLKCKRSLISAQPSSPHATDARSPIITPQSPPAPRLRKDADRQAVPPAPRVRVRNADNPAGRALRRPLCTVWTAPHPKAVRRSPPRAALYSGDGPKGSSLAVRRARGVHRHSSAIGPLIGRKRCKPSAKLSELRAYRYRRPSRCRRRAAAQAEAGRRRAGGAERSVSTSAGH